MKKYLPFIILGLGVLVLGGAFIAMKGKRTEAPQMVEEEEQVTEIAFADRPFTSLTPSSDGHWLYLNIATVKIKDAATLDYELLYKTKNGTTQGVPGTITLGGVIEERKLLLGSESSGKFRYDEGVQEGSLALRFRSSKGKLLGKLTTDFHLLSNTDKLTSLDGNFTMTLDRKATKTYFVVMNTFGLPKPTDTIPSSGPYGVFSSDKAKVVGKVAGDFTQVEGTSASQNVFIK